IRHIAVRGASGNARAARQTLAIRGSLAFRYGLERSPDPGPPSLLEWCRVLGENIFIAFLVLAHNARAFRPDSLWRYRVQIFVSRTELPRRYARPPRPSPLSTCEAAISVPQSLGSLPPLAPDCGDPFPLADTPGSSPGKRGICTESAH